MITASLTPTQREAVERSRAFRAAIAARAVPERPSPERSFGVRGNYVPPQKQAQEVPPQAFPAEPDPPSVASIAGLVVPRIADIQAAVCKFFRIPRKELLGDGRLPNFIHARHIAIYLAASLSRHSGLELGRRFNRDHASIIHAVRRIGRLMLDDENIAHEVATLAEIVTGSTDDVMGPDRDRSSPKSKKVRYWANVYRPVIGACGHVYASKELADQMAGRDRIACVPFTVEMREGDDESSAD